MLWCRLTTLCRTPKQRRTEQVSCRVMREGGRGSSMNQSAMRQLAGKSDAPRSGKERVAVAL